MDVGFAQDVIEGDTMLLHDGFLRSEDFKECAHLGLH